MAYTPNTQQNQVSPPILLDACIFNPYKPSHPHQEIYYLLDFPGLAGIPPATLNNILVNLYNPNSALIISARTWAIPACRQTIIDIIIKKMSSPNNVYGTKIGFDKYTATENFDKANALLKQKLTEEEISRLTILEPGYEEHISSAISSPKLSTSFTPFVNSPLQWAPEPMPDRESIKEITLDDISITVRVNHTQKKSEVTWSDIKQEKNLREITGEGVISYFFVLNQGQIIIGADDKKRELMAFDRDTESVIPPKYQVNNNTLAWGLTKDAYLLSGTEDGKIYVHWYEQKRLMRNFINNDTPVIANSSITAFVELPHDMFIFSSHRLTPTSVMIAFAVLIKNTNKLAIGIFDLSLSRFALKTEFWFSYIPPSDPAQKIVFINYLKVIDQNIVGISLNNGEYYIFDFRSQTLTVNTEAKSDLRINLVLDDIKTFGFPTQQKTKPYSKPKYHFAFKLRSLKRLHLPHLSLPHASNWMKKIQMPKSKKLSELEAMPVTLETQRLNIRNTTILVSNLLDQENKANYYAVTWPNLNVTSSVRRRLIRSEILDIDNVLNNSKLLHCFAYQNDFKQDTVILVRQSRFISIPQEGNFISEDVYVIDIFTRIGSEVKYSNIGPLKLNKNILSDQKEKFDLKDIMWGNCGNQLIVVIKNTIYKVPLTPDNLIKSIYRVDMVEEKGPQFRPKANFITLIKEKLLLVRPIMISGAPAAIIKLMSTPDNDLLVYYDLGNNMAQIMLYKFPPAKLLQAFKITTAFPRNRLRNLRVISEKFSKNIVGARYQLLALDNQPLFNITTHSHRPYRRPSIVLDEKKQSTEFGVPLAGLANFKISIPANQAPQQCILKKIQILRQNPLQEIKVNEKNLGPNFFPHIHCDFYGQLLIAGKDEAQNPYLYSIDENLNPHSMDLPTHADKSKTIALEEITSLLPVPEEFSIAKNFRFLLVGFNNGYLGTVRFIYTDNKGWHINGSIFGHFIAAPVSLSVTVGPNAGKHFSINNLHNQSIAFADKIARLLNAEVLPEK